MKEENKIIKKITPINIEYSTKKNKRLSLSYSPIFEEIALLVWTDKYKSYPEEVAWDDFQLYIFKENMKEKVLSMLEKQGWEDVVNFFNNKKNIKHRCYWSEKELLYVD